MRTFLAAWAIALCAVTAAAAQQQTIFVVRHAERADGGTPPAGMTTPADPDLSAAGHERARSLAVVLKDAGITTIVTTEFKRTVQTAEPLAKALGVEIVRVSSKDTSGLAKRVREATGNVLVVGHSNTVPELFKAMGIATAVSIGDQEFDNLYIVSGEPAKPALLRLHYR